MSPTDSLSTGPTEAMDLTWEVAEERTTSGLSRNTEDYRGILSRLSTIELELLGLVCAS